MLLSLKINLYYVKPCKNLLGNLACLHCRNFYGIISFFWEKNFIVLVFLSLLKNQDL
jgi:hypothetical protein